DHRARGRESAARSPGHDDVGGGRRLHAADRQRRLCRRSRRGGDVRAVIHRGGGGQWRRAHQPRSEAIRPDHAPIACRTAGPTADGSFTIDRAPRHYSVLSAEAGDLGGEISQTAARPVIRLMPRPSVSGAVHDAEGRPLRGVAITLTSEQNEAVAVSDAGGHFTMHVAPDTYEASSDSASYRLRYAKLHVDKAIIKDFVAERAPILTGIVRREDGSPVAGAQVIVATEDAT